MQCYDWPSFKARRLIVVRMGSFSRKTGQTGAVRTFAYFFLSLIGHVFPVPEEGFSVVVCGCVGQ